MNYLKEWTSKDFYTTIKHHEPFSRCLEIVPRSTGKWYWKRVMIIVGSLDSSRPSNRCWSTKEEEIVTTIHRQLQTV